MIYDVVEVCAAVVAANFNADMAAIVALKGEAGLTTTATIYKRQPAAVFASFQDATLPGVGIWVSNMTTMTADGANERRGHALLHMEYLSRGPDPDKISKQAELAAEALLKSMDRFHGAGAGVCGGGGVPDSVTIELTPLFYAPNGTDFEQEAHVICPVDDRDTV